MLDHGGSEGERREGRAVTGHWHRTAAVPRRAPVRHYVHPLGHTQETAFKFYLFYAISAND